MTTMMEPVKALKFPLLPLPLPPNVSVEPLASLVTKMVPLPEKAPSNTWETARLSMSNSVVPLMMKLFAMMPEAASVDNSSVPLLLVMPAVPKLVAVPGTTTPLLISVPPV